MRGTILRRGKASWRIKIDIGRNAEGKRRYAYATVRGKKADADAKLTEMLTSFGKGDLVRPSKATVSAWVEQRIDAWVHAGEIGGATEQGYRRALDAHIVPYLGTRIVQELRPLDIEKWHHQLRKVGKAPRTICHAHRVLGKALREATKFGLVTRNVCSSPAGGQRAPKVARREMQILTEIEIKSVLESLRSYHERRGNRGRPFQLGHTLYPKIAVALFTGMRRSEVLGLRWQDVDLDERVIRVRQALEETKKYGIRVKATKTGAGRRDIALPDIVIDALTEHRREQLEVRLRLGIGRLTDDALVFPALDGGPQSPRNFSGDWHSFRIAAKAPEVGLHGLRHTHASMLIAAGVDIVEISKRLGHRDPAITLAVYSHLFRSDDSKSAAAIEATLARISA